MPRTDITFELLSDVVKEHELGQRYIHRVARLTLVETRGWWKWRRVTTQVHHAILDASLSISWYWRDSGDFCPAWVEGLYRAWKAKA